MNYTEQAIKKAREGGYGDHAYCNEFDMYENEGSYCFSTVFLDPLFWQSLGKALGWELFREGDDEFGTDWETEWHRFIDHLIDGKEPEEFFKEILAALNKENDNEKV